MDHDDDAPASKAAAATHWVVADPPPSPDGVTASEAISMTAGVLGLVALDVATGGLLSAIGSVPGGPSEATASAPPAIIPGTAAPAVRDDGRVACTRCGTAVAYAAMHLNQHGYFCPACGPSQPS